MIASPAFSHDPFEITTLGRISSDALTLHVTMTRANALALTAGDRKFEPIAPTLFDVTSRGRPLRLKSATVSELPENELEFRLIYERPEAGPLRLRAAHLLKLGDGYEIALTLTQDTPRAVLGLQVMRRTKPLLDTVVVAEITTNPSALDSQALPPWSLGASVGSVSCLALALWFIRAQRARRS